MCGFSDMTCSTRCECVCRKDSCFCRIHSFPGCEGSNTDARQPEVPPQTVLLWRKSAFGLNLSQRSGCSFNHVITLLLQDWPVIALKRYQGQRECNQPLAALMWAHVQADSRTTIIHELRGHRLNTRTWPAKLSRA